MQDNQKLFRDQTGNVKKLLSFVEGITFQDNPLDFFILLARYKFLIRFLKKTDRVIDVGCGHGLGTVFLSKYAKEVIGADVDENLIKKNNSEYKKISNIKFEKLDLLEDKKSREKFNVLISLDVIEHFTKEQTEIVAKNYANLIEEDGFAIIGTPNIASKPYASQRRLDSHIHEFTYDEFEELLNRNFKRVFIFSMTDEIVSTTFPKMSWYFMALCIK